MALSNWLVIGWLMGWLPVLSVMPMIACNINALLREPVLLPGRAALDRAPFQAARTRSEATACHVATAIGDWFDKH
jgi:hypothetical protein